MDLVILAAGMGSRFGGPKQVEPVDDDGNFIIDYSIRDAASAGFDHVILIIREKDLGLFQDTVGSRIPSGMKVDYVFQEMQTIPDSRIPSDRTKPLGTAHAILCCKDAITDRFLVINADDYYGPGSYQLAMSLPDDGNLGCITYRAGETITDNGTVKRGVCTIDSDMIAGITESRITKVDDHIRAEPIDGSEPFDIPLEAPVSMNMFILPPSLMEGFSEQFDSFLDGMKDPMKDEFLLPDVVNRMLVDGGYKLRNLVSTERWYGVTYREDLSDLKEALKNVR